MKAAQGRGVDNSLKALSRTINQPAITLAAIVLALVLGVMRLPFLQYLRPVGDFYIALLQICVLPFLLATIPLAIRSAMDSGSAPGVLRSLLFWVLITLAAVAALSVIIPSLFFDYSAPDEQMINRIGALLGRSADNIDVEFAIDRRHVTEIKGGENFGIFSLIPTNIFASLSSNDSVRVLVFAAIFGVGMVLTERESGKSIFDALRHIQAVCTLIFDWFSLLVAPMLCAFALRASPASVFGALLKPMMLGASTRNSLVCVPLALDTLKNDLKVKDEPCDLYLPIGIATIRFGTILYFVSATLFIGTLMGRHFSLIDLGLLAVFSVGASFATLGLSGLAALAPLAIVLRPFGLSYEVAVPLMIIIDPLADMVRTMLNVAINCMIPTLAGGRGTIPTVQLSL